MPKFVVKRLKFGNPLGTLIHSNNLRQPFQDAWKGDYLCSDCEQLFGRWETWTCKNIYDPFLKTGKVAVAYDEKFGLFAASLCFRYIQFAFDEKPQKQPEELLAKMIENLRVSLLSKDFPNIGSRLYIHFLKPVTSPGQFPPGVNTYFFEAIDGAYFRWIFPPENFTWMVYVKLPGCFFILSGCDLKMICSPPSAIDSHAIQKSGTLDSSSQSDALIGLVSDNIKNRSIEIQASYSKMSAARLAKNSAKISSLPNKQKYRAHQSFTLDQNLLANWPKEAKS